MDELRVEDGNALRRARNRKERKNQFHADRAKRLPKWAGGEGLVEPRGRPGAIHAEGELSLKVMIGFIMFASFLVVASLTAFNSHESKEILSCSTRNARPFTLPRKPMALACTNPKSEIFMRDRLERMSGRVTTRATCTDTGLKRSSPQCSNPRTALTTTTEMPSRRAQSSRDDESWFDEENLSSYRGALVVVEDPFSFILATHSPLRSSDPRKKPTRYSLEKAVKEYKAHIAFWTKSTNSERMIIRKEDMINVTAWAGVVLFLSGQAQLSRSCLEDTVLGEVHSTAPSVDFLSREQIEYVSSTLKTEICQYGYASTDSEEVFWSGLECSDQDQRDWNAFAAKRDNRLRVHQQYFESHWT